MSAVLPFLCLILIVAGIHRRTGAANGASPSWRVSFLSGAVVWGTMLVLMTEVLGLFHCIAFWPMLGSWVAAALGSAAFCLGPRSRTRKAGGGRNTIAQPPGQPVLRRIVILTLAAVVGALLLIALVSPPNNWDSMTYHLSRVQHWIQDRSVEHYPTHIVRQLFMSPFAEFVVLHLQVLSGGDRLANLVQFLSMIGCLSGVSILAGRLGAGKAGSLLAAVLCATVPMGILQSTSTQTDYVVAFWLTSFACLLFALREAPSLWNYALAGGSLGLTVLTKPTALIYAFPLVVWAMVISVRALGWKTWKPALLVPAAFLLLNAGYFSRNVELFGSVLGRDVAVSDNHVINAANETITLPLLLSNMARHLSVHLGTPSERLNAAIRETVERFHDVLGVSPNDPRTTIARYKFEIPSMNSRHEDEAGNPAHLILIGAAMAVFLASRRFPKRSLPGVYLLCLIAAFPLFCACVRWQPWASRLHLPLFVLFCPFVAFVGEACLSARPAHLFMIALLLLSLPWVLLNRSRPMIGRENIFNSSRMSLYFANNPDLFGRYASVADALRIGRCGRVGLVMGENDWEYPLWVMLREGAHAPVLIEHVDVKNVSAGLARRGDWPGCGEPPDAIVEWSHPGGQTRLTVRGPADAPKKPPGAIGE